MPAKLRCSMLPRWACLSGTKEPEARWTAGRQLGGAFDPRHGLQRKPKRDLGVGTEAAHGH